MFSIKSRKHCLPTKNTVRFLPTQKCCTHCCLTECIYPQETAGLIGTAECINSSHDTIGVTNEKQREAMYKNALLHNQCREWVSLIKTSYGRNKERIQAGKKTINIDERYMSSAEKFLYGELAVVMEMPRDKVSGYVKEHLDTAMV